VTLDGLDNVEVEFTATGATKTLGYVQLEAGPTANVFRRNANSLQSELAACQRYFVSFSNEDGVGSNVLSPIGSVNTTSTARFSVPLPVTMRIPPNSLSYTQNTPTGQFIQLYDVTNNTAYSSFPNQNITFLSTFSTKQYAMILFNLTTASLTVGRPVILLTNGSFASQGRIAIEFGAEL
jgi:hypothetical protein